MQASSSHEAAEPVLQEAGGLPQGSMPVQSAMDITGLLQPQETPLPLKTAAHRSMLMLGLGQTA